MSEHADLPGTIKMTSSLALVACSLDATGQQARLAEWNDLLAQATSRRETPTGVCCSFAAADGLDQQICDLVAAEQSCCSFLTFEISHDEERTEMTVSAPGDGLDALHFIFSR